AHEDVPLYAAREAEVGHGHVGDTGREIGAAGAGNALRLLAQQRQHHGDVVRREAPENVLLVADLADVQAVRINVLDAAQRAGAYQLAQLQDPRGVLQDGTPE